MDLPSRLGLLALQVKDYLRENVEPHLSAEEHLNYLEDHQGRIKFTVTTIRPGAHILVKSPKLDTATVLDAIVGQVVFGRDAMMQRDWFRSIYSRHAARLDSLPRKMVHELRQIRYEFFGKQKDFSVRMTMPAIAETDSSPSTPTASDTSSDNSSNIADDLLALLNKQNEEFIELEKKHRDELKGRFDSAVECYPGLSGVLCGVQHSFRGRADQPAERRALINATMEYIARNGS